MLVSEIIDYQDDPGIAISYMPGRMTHDQEENVLSFSKKALEREYFIQQIRVLREGYVAEKRAAAALARLFARNAPDQDVVEIFDWYLSQRNNFDRLVAAEMAISISRYDMSLLEADEAQHLSQFQDAVEMWKLHSDSIREVMISAKDIFDRDDLNSQVQE